MQIAEPENQTGQALRHVIGPDLELRMAAFLAAQAAGYDLIERGTGRRISFESTSTGVEPACGDAGEPLLQCATTKTDRPLGRARKGSTPQAKTSNFQEGAAGSREQNAPAIAPRLAQQTEGSVPPSAVNPSTCPAAASALPTALAAARPPRGKRPMAPKQRRAGA